MQKLLLALSLIMCTTILAMQEESDLDNTDAKLARIISRYQFIRGWIEECESSKTINLENLIINLISKQKYGPALADLLDLDFSRMDYTYLGKGIYSHVRGPNVHSKPRHLCEADATQIEAETKSREMEPPSFVGRDGTRHYAMMH